MKAAFADRYGGPDVVKLRQVERPAPTGDHILVRVRAASVNRADLDGLKPKPGFLRLFTGIRAPRNQEMGIDAAGTRGGAEVVWGTELGPGVAATGLAAGHHGLHVRLGCGTATQRAVRPATSSAGPASVSSVYTDTCTASWWPW